LPSGDYLPIDDFANLEGCDLNGDWTIHVLDNIGIDNGYIFSWQLIFNQDIIPDDLWTFTNSFDDANTFWTGDGIVSDVDGNAIAQPTTSGDLEYVYTAVDDFGCTYDVTLPLHVLPATDPTCCSEPFANAGEDDVVCGPSYTLHTDLDLPVNNVLWAQIAGPGTTNFAGNETSTDPTVTVNQYGTYTYTLTEENLSPTCSDIDTVEITFYEIPNSNFSTTVIPCNGNVTTVTYNGNATAGATYNWNFGGGLPITGSGQGPYQVAWADAGVHTITLSVQENGCSSNESNETVLNPEELTHVLTTQDDPCNGTCEGLASVQADGGTLPYTYSWGPTSVSSDLCAGAYSITVTDDNGCETSENFVINEPAPIVITNVSTEDITCFNQANGEIIITAVGGYGALTYSWSDGGTGAQRLSLPAGMYGLTITDQNGCFITDQYTLTQPDELLISISPDQAHCEGEVSTITSQAVGGTEPYTYYWNSGSGFAPASNVITVAPSTTTTYVVYAQDANGCQTAPVSMTMTISPQMFMTLTTEDNRCHGSCDGEAQLFVDGGIPPINYSWSAPGAVYSNLCAGVYDVTITDMLGCQVDTVFQIHEPPQLFGDVYTTDATCNGYDNGEAFVEVVGGVPDYTYLWPDGSTEDDITAEAGVYTVTVADAHDCRIELDAVIGEPDRIELTMGSGDRWICKSNSTQLLAYAVGGTPIPGGSYDFIWSGTDGSEYIIHNPEVSPDTTTVYTVYAIDDNSCRSEEHEVTVNVYPDLMIESLTTSYDTICIGDPAIVEAVVSGGNGGPYQLTLHDGQVVPAPFTVYPMETTYYIVTLDDACGTPSVQDSVLINVMPRPANSFVSDKVEGCPPFSVKFNEMSEDEGQTYLWNFGDDGFAEVKNPTHVYETPGFYPVTLTVTSEFGCAKTVTVDHMIHVFEKPLADFYTDQDYVSVLDPEIQFFNISENADSAFWFFGDGDSSLFINPIHNFVNIGSYDVMLIAESIRGCRDTIVKTISVRDEFTFYAPTAFTPNGDGDNDFFMVTGNGIDPNEFTMRVYDRWGELVFETDAYDPDRPVGSAWDGTYQGDRSKGDRLLHHGVYSWYCRFKDFTGVWHEYEGTVTLMR
jgi:gliding motility-associated-like protein